MEQITMVQVDVLHPHEKNPRIDAASVAELVESIREHGVEVPLVVAPQLGEERWVVLAGHRRLTAALQLGLEEVPAQIRPDLTDARDQLAFMATENIHRDQLTAVEESRLVQDMLDLGMSEAEVAKQTALAKKRVAERVKLKKLTGDAGEKLHRGQITVDDALVIAEYSDDPEIAEQLNETAGTGMFDWTVSRAKQRREKAKMLEDGRKLAKKHGLRLVDAAADFVSLSELLSEAGWSTPALEKAAGVLSDQEWGDLVHAEHKTCPGHSARVIEYGAERGNLEVGCDQVSEQHAGAAAAGPVEEAVDPWEELTADDFEAARIHREQHLAKALPQLDITDEGADILVDAVVSQCWREWGNDDAGIALLETLTGHEGNSRVRRKLKTWPLPLLAWLNHHWWSISTTHRYMAQGRPGSSYWGEKSSLRQLLERTGYAWSEPEQRAILLATGKAHDATDAADGADNADSAAEGGEAA